MQQIVIFSIAYFLQIFLNPPQTLFQEFLFTSNADVAGFVFRTMISTCAGTESHGS